MRIINGTVCDPKSKTLEQADLVIDHNKIVAILKSSEDKAAYPIEKEEEVIDAAGMIVAPGLVDGHVHFRDPGFTYKEDIFSGAKAAAAGGVTSVILMANTNPAVDTVETLEYVLERGRQTDIHIYSCANVTMGLKGEKLTDMKALARAGAVGFTDDGIPIMDASLLREALKVAAELDMPVSLHEENKNFIENNGVNRGKASAHYGIGGSDRQAEIDLIARDIPYCEETGAELTIQHISTREGVELVRQAKAKKIPVHAEATPHHFTLTEDAVIKYGTNAKMNPPLREEEDRLAIIRGLQDGTIDMIATDHAPHSAEEKEKAITDAPSGILGLETSLALGVRELVKPGYMDYIELFDRMAYGPARLYKIDAGYLEVNGPADMVIFNPDETWTVEHFCSKASNSPFIGDEMPGKIHYTICDGRVIYQC